MIRVNQQNQNNEVPESKKKNPSMKNFEFDDLPGIGWKKLKGFISWGSKKTKAQENKQEQAPIQQEQTH